MSETQTTTETPEPKTFVGCEGRGCKKRCTAEHALNYWRGGKCRTCALSLGELIRSPKLRLSAFERRCGVLWVNGWTETEIFLHEFREDWATFREAKPSSRCEFEHRARRQVRRSVEVVVAQVERFRRDLSEAGTEFAKGLLDAYRNRTASGASEHVVLGLLPTVHLKSDASKDERKEFFKNPRHYWNASLRGPVVSVRDLPQRKRESLRHLAAGL